MKGRILIPESRECPKLEEEEGKGLAKVYPLRKGGTQEHASSHRAEDGPVGDESKKCSEKEKEAFGKLGYCRSPWGVHHAFAKGG